MNMLLVNSIQVFFYANLINMGSVYVSQMKTNYMFEKAYSVEELDKEYWIIAKMFLLMLFAVL